MKPREIVFEFVVFERGVAVAGYVGDFYGARGPDVFGKFEIAIVDDAD